jgi:small nuclear ribonucleoprotein (snRNP)-like protein
MEDVAVKKALPAILMLVAAAVVNADVSNTVLSGLVEKQVAIVQTGGAEVTGTLSSYDDQSVVLIQADGTIVTVARDEIASVRVIQGATAKAPEPQAEAPQEGDRPVAFLNLLLDPLGFLQMGPVAEVEFRILPSTLLAATVRFEGLGLVYQAVASEGFENTVSPTSIAIGVTVYQLIPARGANRIYIAGFVGYGWGSSEGGSGSYAWSSTWGQIEVGGGGGYRWRFPSGFFLDVGAVAGVGYNPGTKWSYDDAPHTYFTNDPMATFIGMLQLHVGWEL